MLCTSTMNDMCNCSDWQEERSLILRTSSWHIIPNGWALWGLVFLALGLHCSEGSSYIKASALTFKFMELVGGRTRTGSCSLYVKNVSKVEDKNKNNLPGLETRLQPPFIIVRWEIKVSKEQGKKHSQGLQSSFPFAHVVSFPVLSLAPCSCGCWFHGPFELPLRGVIVAMTSRFCR